jgi:hypothetical protein
MKKKIYIFITRTSSLNIFKIAFAFIFISFLMGCATLAVEQALDRPTTYPSFEFQNQKNGFKFELDGQYHNQRKINNQDYGIIQIKGAPGSCRQNSDIELLIPFGSDANSEAILNESPTYTDVGLPVKIIFNPIPGREIGDVNNLLPPDTWKGYPSVIIMHGIQTEKGLITVAYRTGSDLGNIRIRTVNVSELKWICRDKKKYIESMIFEPFTCVLDIITFPIQFLFMFIILIIGKGGP